MGFSAVIDCLILLWLVGTWFYEGHHKKCRVALVCPKCGTASEVPCDADHHNH